MKRVLFVCTGNICRSPTAEAIFSEMVRREGMSHLFAADSAGTHGYHVGEPPDPRSTAAALQRGYDLSALRARRVEPVDFSRFDLVLAMDATHHAFLARLCPPEAAHKLHLIMEFARTATAREVPDPYYGGAGGFEEVLDLLEDASHGLLQFLLKSAD